MARQVTIFKSITVTDTPYQVPVDEIITRLKTGKHKALINQIQCEADKDKRNALKKQLPAICWSGTFTERKDSAIVDHSGLVCLDYDNFDCVEDMQDLRDTFTNSPYCFACFTSPSGNGLKLVVKIPPIVENHRLHFKALEQYFKSEYFDRSSVNVSRVCYESFDPDAFYNPDSQIFTELHDEIENPTGTAPAMPETNHNIIIDNLQKWWAEKWVMQEGDRNNVLHKLASALNRYGIDQTEAFRACVTNASGLNESEVLALVRSAYKRRDEHNTQAFEDKKAVNRIHSELIKGKNKEEIAQGLIDQGRLSQDQAKAIVEKVEQENPVDVFWEETKKGIKIVNWKYKNWLKAKGFEKYYADDSDSYVFVGRVSCKYYDTSEERMKDFVLNWLQNEGHLDVYEYMSSRPRYFKEDYLGLLENAAPDFIQDTADTAHLYFNNAGVTVTKDKIEVVPYVDIKGNIWGKHCLERDFKETAKIDNDFKTLIWNVSGKDKGKRDSIESTIGFLLHSFKTSAKNRAIILNDEMISENPNGGTGKGIFINAIGHMKRLVTIDGKNFAPDKSFAYQTVQVDTQVLCLDDIKKNFNFEALFSIITEGITLEKKNKDAIKLPITKSPKLLIATNYAVKGEGNSFERRKFELEFAQHYNSKHTPLDEFGCMLFEDWDAEHWHRFDNYMIKCVQLYLKNGLIESEFNNLAARKFIVSTCHDFYEYVNDTDLDNMPLDERIDKKSKYEDFLEAYPDFKKWLSAKKFNQWVESYARFLGHDYVTGSSNGKRWHMIKTSDLEIEEEKEGIEYEPKI